MLTSVAMCTFNGAKHLQEQLESIAAQTQRPSELVICDDGSTDETPSLVEAFARRAPFELSFHRNSQRLGSSANFEKAMRLCRGEFIALCDQDDSWFTEKLAKQSEFLSKNPEIDAVFSDGELMDEQSTPLGTTIWESIRFGNHDQAEVTRGNFATVLLRRNVITGATLMLRSSFLNRCLPVASNWVHDGWIAWMLALHSRAGLIPEKLIRYRVHATQQVGLPPTALRSQITRARQTTGQSYADAASMFQELLQYVDQSSTTNRETLHPWIEEKIAFLRFRQELPAAPAKRWLEVLRRRHWYARYSQAWSSMTKDAFFRV